MPYTVVIAELKQETNIPFDLFIDAKGISSSELIKLLFNLKLIKKGVILIFC